MSFIQKIVSQFTTEHTELTELILRVLRFRDFGVFMDRRILGTLCILDFSL